MDTMASGPVDESRQPPGYWEDKAAAAEDRATAAEMAGDLTAAAVAYDEAAAAWQRGVWCSIGHNRRDRYERRHDKCRARAAELRKAARAKASAATRPRRAGGAS